MSERNQKNSRGSSGDTSKTRGPLRSNAITPVLSSVYKTCIVELAWPTVHKRCADCVRAVVAILMMITESRTFTLDVGQSLRLDCEFYMDNFDMFDNPVIWKKRQHGSMSTSSQINTMRNIHRPFVRTGRFDVSLTSAAPRYRLQLGIASKSVAAVD